MKHIKSYCPFDDTNYKYFFKQEYGIQLGTVSFHEATVIYNAFKLISKKLLNGLISIIEFDPSLGPSKKIYPNHGRWENNFKTMILNRAVIDLEPEESKHLIIHETGHAIDNKLGNISNSDEWLKLSNWTEDPPGITPFQKSDNNFLICGNFERLSIKEKNMYTVSGWWHSKDAGFPRFYASRNPEEDFAECFAYYLLGEMNRFKTCPAKAKFIKEKVLDSVK